MGGRVSTVFADAIGGRGARVGAKACRDVGGRARTAVGAVGADLTGAADGVCAAVFADGVAARVASIFAFAGGVGGAACRARRARRAHAAVRAIRAELAGGTRRVQRAAVRGNRSPVIAETIASRRTGVQAHARCCGGAVAHAAVRAIRAELAGGTRRVQRAAVRGNRSPVVAETIASRRAGVQAHARCRGGAIAHAAVGAIGSELAGSPRRVQRAAVRSDRAAVVTAAIARSEARFRAQPGGGGRYRAGSAIVAIGAELTRRGDRVCHAPVGGHIPAVFADAIAWRGAGVGAHRVLLVAAAGPSYCRDNAHCPSDPSSHLYLSRPPAYQRVSSNAQGFVPLKRCTCNGSFQMTWSRERRSNPSRSRTTHRTRIFSMYSAILA